jgi:hypothetical protein
MKAAYILLIATKFVVFCCVFVRFSARGAQKHHKKVLGKIRVKNCVQKMRGGGGGGFPRPFLPQFF